MNYFIGAAMGEETRVLLTLFIMLAAAKFMAELFERLRQPAVAGEIMAGILIGPSLLNLAAPSEITSILAEIGVIFLLFNVGLETKPAAIFKVGKSAAMVAVLGVVLPFVSGWLLMTAWGSTSVESLFVGTALVATSVGITARVLSAMGLLDAPTARIILGAAVIDDILGLLVLAVVSSMAAGAVNYVAILTTAALAIGFTVFMAFVAAPVVTRVAPSADRLRSGHGMFILGLVLCLGLSVAAAFIGVAAIIGSFLAGMAMAEASERSPQHAPTNKRCDRISRAVFSGQHRNAIKAGCLSLPFDRRSLRACNASGCGNKTFGCGLGAINLGIKRAAQVGMGMVPRGEVGIIVAQIGLSLAVIGPELYGVVLFMAVATTLIAPPFLKILYASEPAAEAEIGPADAGGIVASEDLCKIG